MVYWCSHIWQFEYLNFAWSECCFWHCWLQHPLDHFGCYGSLAESVLRVGFTHVCLTAITSPKEALSFSCTDVVPGPSVETWLRAPLLSDFRVRLSSLKWQKCGGAQKKALFNQAWGIQVLSLCDWVINALPLSVLGSSPLSGVNYAYILLHLGGSFSESI